MTEYFMFATTADAIRRLGLSVQLGVEIAPSDLLEDDDPGSWGTYVQVPSQSETELVAALHAGTGVRPFCSDGL